MTVLGCSGFGCHRSISVSVVPGGNPMALADPGTWATEYLACHDCGSIYCDRCARHPGAPGACPVCHAWLVDSSLREPAARPPAIEAHRRGRELYRQRRFAEALDAFDRAVALRPDFPEAHLFRAYTLNELGRAEEMETALQAVLAIDRRHVPALFRLGGHQLDAGRPQAAIATYDQVASLQGLKMEARVNRIVALLQMRRHDEALAAAETLIRESEEAVQEFQQAMRDRDLARAGSVQRSELLNKDALAKAYELKADAVRRGAGAPSPDRAAPPRESSGPRPRSQDHQRAEPALLTVRGMERLPLARTVLESEWFLGHHPCLCGGIEPPAPTRRVISDGREVLWHDGQCPTCRRPWATPFGIPAAAPRFGTTWATFFGGPEPSTLLDAGEWLMVEEVTASSDVPGRFASYAEITRHQELITVATAAMTEAIKFIREPGPFGRLEASACWTDHGRAKVRHRGQGEYTWRVRLEAFRSGLGDALDRYGGGVYEGVPITGDLTVPPPTNAEMTEYSRTLEQD